MNLKHYSIARLAIAALLAALVSISVSVENFIIPIFAVAATMILMIILKKNVKDVIADERIYELAGKAARYAIAVYAGVAFLGTMALFTYKDTNPSFEAVGSALAYSACAIMLIYSLIFSFLNRGMEGGRRKVVSMVIIVIIALTAAVASVRFLSGEDTWICEDGQWIRHGQPDAPMPEKECEGNRLNEGGLPDNF